MTMADTSRVTCDFEDAYTMTNRISIATTVKGFKRGTQGFDLMSGGKCGWNVCGAAATKNNPELIEYLVGQEPLLLEHPNEFGWTPLFCAVDGSAYEAACKLVELGAGVNVVTSGDCDSGGIRIVRGTSPLHHALRVNSADIAQLLIEHGGLVSPALTDAQRKTAEERLWILKYFK
jgi:hypothetical protein